MDSVDLFHTEEYNTIDIDVIKDPRLEIACIHIETKSKYLVCLICDLKLKYRWFEDIYNDIITDIKEHNISTDGNVTFLLTTKIVPKLDLSFLQHRIKNQHWKSHKADLLTMLKYFVDTSNMTDNDEMLYMATQYYFIMNLVEHHLTHDNITMHCLKNLIGQKTLLMVRNEVDQLEYEHRNSEAEERLGCMERLARVIKVYKDLVQTQNNT